MQRVDRIGVRSWIALIAASAAVAAAFIVHYQSNTSLIYAADAWGYVFHAFRFRLTFPLDDFGSVRTYGYPLFLYALSFLSGFDPSKLSLATALVQYGLYLSAVIWVVRQVEPFSKPLSIALFLGLAVNPVLLSSVTDVLTEGLSLVAFVTLLGLALSIVNSTDGRRRIINLVLGSFVVAIALMVRPSNIVLGIAWYATVLVMAVTVRLNGRASVKIVLAGAAIGALSSAAIVLSPQVFYNLRHFNSATFLPYCQLGSFQFYTSAFMWKYDAIVIDNAASGVIYLNPLLDGSIDAKAPWNWYISDPVAGITTLAAHVFNLFSVTSLFTYTRDAHPFYELPLRSIYWALILLGVWGAVSATVSSVTDQDRSLLPPKAFVILCFLGFVAVGSISAVEQRFGVVPLAILSVAGFHKMLNIRLAKFSLVRAALLIIGTSACVAVAYGMDRLSGDGFGDHKFAFALGDDCLITLDRLSPEDLFAAYESIIEKPGH